MAPRVQALAHSQVQERTHSSPKYFKASVIIAVGGMDVDVGFLVNLRRFIEEECMIALCSVEQGGVLTDKHFQMMVVKGDFSSLPVLNKRIEVCLRCDECPLICHVVSCKRLRDEGLRTFSGMVGYCTKDNREEHF